MEPNHTAVSTATKRNILFGILDKGTSQTAVAKQAGITKSTFNRKIQTGDFTLRELGLIAEALDRPLADILPADLIKPDAA